MVLSPPLVVSRDQIDELVALARKAIERTAAEF
jgi:adenosylmethionine-8-amino-7-oxononanoate aminotransferase